MKTDLEQISSPTIKIAIPTSNGVLNMHFGHCEKFTLLEISDKKVVQKQEVDAPPHEPGLLPRWLADKKVTLVIAGGMGQRAKELFAKENIKVITGAPSKAPDAIVEEYLSGSLITGVNFCDH